MDCNEAGTVCQRILDAVGEAVAADDRFLESVLTGVLAQGHLLLEDVPEMGKTLTARCFASALNLSFFRIHTAGCKSVTNFAAPGRRISSRSYSRQYQFTPDGSSPSLMYRTGREAA